MSYKSFSQLRILQIMQNNNKQFKNVALIVTKYCEIINSSKKL